MPPDLPRPSLYAVAPVKCPVKIMPTWPESGSSAYGQRQNRHHHAKCLGPIHAAENLPANSIQFIGYLMCQWEYECGVNALKWNVQPRAVIERNKMCLSGLGFEIHDDVLSEGVLSPDFQHGKQLGEMAFGEFGIDG
jgi:hypothetical protein